MATRPHAQVSAGVVGRHRCRTPPRLLAVLPEADLNEGQHAQDGQAGGRPAGLRRCGQAQPVQQPGGGPDDSDEQADVRQVNETVGARLHAGLQQTDNWHERAQEPQPANDQGWLLAAPVPRPQADRAQHYQGDRYNPAKLLECLIGIIKRQVEGQKSLQNIPAVKCNGMA